jgi:ATP-dependent Clp protease protease subunit
MAAKKDKDQNDLTLFTEYSIHLPTRTVMLTGDVDSDMYDTLITALTLMEKDGKEIIIELNSPGGDWYSGVAIYDRLRSSQCPITIRVSGMAMSMGSVILQAGDKRLITPNSTVMIHDGSDVAVGTPDNVLEWAKHGKDICDRMYKIYAEASGKTESYWKKRCKKDSIYSADDAIKYGLADGFIE